MISQLLRIRNVVFSWFAVARGERGIIGSSADVPPEPPWPVMAVALAVIAANVTMIFSGGQITGVSIDEPTHVERLQSYREGGWYVPKWQLNGGDSTARDRFVYGPVAAATAQLIAESLKRLGLMASAAGDPDNSAIETSAAAYAVRHATVGLFSVLGLVGLAALSRRLFGSWRWGFLAVAALLAIPQWTGHAMFNIKDIPAASGFILVLLGLVSLGDPSVFSSRTVLRTSALALVGGLYIAIGTRPGIWPVIALMMLLTMVSTYMRGVRRADVHTSRGIAKARVTVLAACVVVAHLLLLASYPKAFSTPFEAALRSAKVASKYNWSGWSLSAGTIHNEYAPWWYIPAWLFNQIPVLLLGLAFVGLWASMRMLRAASLRGRDGDFGTRNVVALHLLLALIVAIPLGAVLRHSIMYDGIRQILFIIPLWSTMTMIGLWSLVRHSTPPGRFSAVVSTASYAVFALAILVPTVDQYRLFPYNYAYFNEYAALQPIDGRWPTDYWQTSFRELASKIPGDVLLDCRFQSSFGRMNEGRLEIPPRRRPEEGCKSGVIAPFIATPKATDQTRNGSKQSFWIIHENRLGLLVPPNCLIEDKITRPLRGQTLTMSWIARCQADPAD